MVGIPDFLAVCVLRSRFVGRVMSRTEARRRYVLAGAGSFVTMPQSSRTVINMAIIEKFVDVHFVREELIGGQWRVNVVRRK